MIVPRGILSAHHAIHLSATHYSISLHQLHEAELLKKAESALTPNPTPSADPTLPLAEAPVEVLEKKQVVLPAEQNRLVDNDKALAVVETQPLTTKSSSVGSLDRDIALAEVEKEKRLSYVKAWEDSEKTKAQNKAEKQLSAVAAWENSKKAAIEAKLKTIEEQLERKKAEYGEKMKNKMALIHKEAEEKRAMVEAKRGEELLKADEMAANHRATGTTPKKLLGCF